MNNEVKQKLRKGQTVEQTKTSKIQSEVQLVPSQTKQKEKRKFSKKTRRFCMWPKCRRQMYKIMSLFVSK